MENENFPGNEVAVFAFQPFTEIMADRTMDIIAKDDHPACLEEHITMSRELIYQGPRLQLMTTRAAGRVVSARGSNGTLDWSFDAGTDRVDLSPDVLSLIAYVMIFIGVMLSGALIAFVLRKLLKVAMLSLAIGSPICHASQPAKTLPKFPVGTM